MLPFASPVRRSAPRCGRERRLTTLLAAVCLIGFAALATAAPAPATLQSAAPRLDNPANDPADVAEYLSYWQARAYQRSAANMRPATANQLTYDVHYYNLDLHPNVPTKVLSGTIRMTASVVSGPISSVDLDLDNTTMTCDAATSAGFATTFAQGGGILTVQLDRTYATGENIDVTVQYHGTPTSGAFGAAFGFDAHGSSTLVSTLSEPFDARTWWPCKDDPADKADSADIAVTLPSGYVIASNGVRVANADNGTTVYTRWHERHPIATYLISIACFPYTVVTDWYRPTPTDSMEIRFHLFPEMVASTATVHAKVKNMITAFAAKFGPYPFQDEKYGHAEFLWGGGMENQTCTSLGSFGEYTVAHELGHQWFGDAVTCRDFHHIWVNEGFATFCESIWAEYNGGIGAFHSRMAGNSYYGSGTIYVPDLTDANRIFSTALTYHKPAWVLAMLRHLMGDANFFLALRTYLAQHYYDTATTEDFQAVCEQVSGLDLSKFFAEWIYGEYYPQYRFASGWVASPGGGYDVTAQIQQVQTWQTFWMPIDVRVNTASGSFTFVANDSTPLQLFTFHVPAAPTSVVLDPDTWVMRTIANVTAVDPMAAAAGLELAMPSPNPTRGATSIRFTTPRDGAVDVDVIDAGGRRVASLQHGAMAAGEHRLEWSGRGADGHALRPGVYWVSAGFDGRRVSRRIAILN
jgi:aminopeptidase N